MLPTHVLTGLALALPYALAVPESAVGVLLAAFLGSLFPDLDLYLGHRRTLHYPVYFAVLAAFAGALSLAVPMVVTIGLAFFLLGAAVHCVMDIFGGGLELRPWEGTSDRAVYDHYTDRWIAPRHWVRYDGSPEDLALSIGLAVPLLITVDGILREVVLASLAVGAVYTVVRRTLPVLAEVLASSVTEQLPAWLHTRVPARYLAGSSDTR